MTTLELAAIGEAEACYAILDLGRRFQQEQGFTQWTEDYPNPDTVRSDIRSGKGYAVRVDGVLAGYLCLDFDGEPAYAVIDGAWSAERPYAVVHRMAFLPQFRGMGLADTTWRLIEARCRAQGVDYIRADTDFPNARMQHILDKNGFRRCGVITFQGSGKIAYDKQL